MLSDRLGLIPMSPSGLYALIFNDWAGALQMAPPVMHLHAGLAILVVARLVLGVPFRSLWLLGIVTLAALAKEAADFAYYGAVKPDSLSDIMYTIAWPAAIVIAARLRPPVRERR